MKKPYNPSPRYGSHVPVLKAIAGSCLIRSVVEFGCGYYSTPLFLDKDVFKHLESLVSLETNLEWGIKFHGTDPRLNMVIGDHENLLMACARQSPVDLIFIDNADSAQRVPNILATHTFAKIIVIHDSEVYYKKFAKPKQHMFHYKKKTPWTMVLSDEKLYLENIL